MLHILGNNRSGLTNRPANHSIGRNRLDLHQLGCHITVGRLKGFGRYDRKPKVGCQFFEPRFSVLTKSISRCDDGNFLNSLLGILLGGGSLFLIATLYQWLFKREGMGGGDVKLLAMIGAFLGWEAVLLTILLSSLIGSITGIMMMVLKGKDFKYAIPFGPFLSLGAAIALFYKKEIIFWYLQFRG